MWVGRVRVAMLSLLLVSRGSLSDTSIRIHRYEGRGFGASRRRVSLWRWGRASRLADSNTAAFSRCSSEDGLSSN